MLATCAINEHMARLIRKALFVLIFLLLLGIAGAYIYRTQASAALLRILVVRSGGTVHVLSNTQLSLNRLQLEQAQISWPLPQGSKIKLNLQGLDTSFKLNNLPKPELTKIALKELLVELNSAAAVNETGSTGPDLFAVLNTLWLPTELLSINKLIVKVHSPQFTALVQSDFEYANKTLHFRTGEFDFTALTKLDPELSGAKHMEAAAIAPSTDHFSANPFSLRLISPLLVKRDDTGKAFLAQPLTILVNAIGFSPALSLGAATVQLDNITLDAASLRSSFKLESSIITPTFGAQPSPFTLDGNLTLAAKQTVPDVEASMLFKKIDGLVPVKQLFASFRYKPITHELIASKLEAQILGARCSVRPFSYILGNSTNKLFLDLEGLNLEKVLALYPDAKVAGSATLDGSLPLEISSKKFSISSGVLEARAPGGTLKGDLSAWAAAHPGNEGLQIAAKALSNLHFDHLKANVTYNPNGNLELQLGIRGQNPDWSKNQPLNLNISVEEHVPSLLKTLELFNTNPVAG